MYIENFTNTAEISTLRNTLFYTKLRPYVYRHCFEKYSFQNMQITAEEEGKLSVEDRYFVKLDILLDQVFKNCKTRQIWKRNILQLNQVSGVSCLEIEALNKVYLNELVVLFERLGRFSTLLRKAFHSDIEVIDLELKLLKFFNPELFKLRNYSHHRLYLGFKGLSELQLIENKVSNNDSFDEYYGKYQNLTRERIDWINYTEKKLSGLLKNYFELLHSKIINCDTYSKPEYLSSNFSILEELNVDIRRKYKHDEIFNA